MTSLLADLRAQPDFRTELWSQPEVEPKSEVTHCMMIKRDVKKKIYTVEHEC